MSHNPYMFGSRIWRAARVYVHEKYIDPNAPTAEEQEAARRFFRSPVLYLTKCFTCHIHFTKVLAESPPETKTKATLVAWQCAAQNRSKEYQTPRPPPVTVELATQAYEAERATMGPLYFLGAWYDFGELAAFGAFADGAHPTAAEQHDVASFFAEWGNNAPVQSGAAALFAPLRAILAEKPIDVASALALKKWYIDVCNAWIAAVATKVRAAEVPKLSLEACEERIRLQNLRADARVIAAREAKTVHATPTAHAPFTDEGKTIVTSRVATHEKKGVSACVSRPGSKTRRKPPAATCVLC